MNKEKIKAHFSNPGNVRSYYSNELSSLKWNGNGQGIGLCPLHDDQRQSFSVKETGAYFCHACNAKGGDVISFHMARHGVDFKAAISDLAVWAGISETKKKQSSLSLADIQKIVIDGAYKFERIHHYKAGNPPYIKAIFKDLAGFKRGIFYTVTDNGLYVSGRKSKPVFYNQERMTDTAKAIFLSESEKDSDMLFNACNFLCLSSGGATSWSDKLPIEILKDKSVILLPHHDGPGRKYAETAAQLLKDMASSIKVINSETWGAHKGADISDWIAARQAEGKTAEAIKQELRAIVKDAPEWKEPEAAAETPESKGLVSSLIKWNEIHSLNTSTEHLLDRLIPEGAITLLFGRGGIGKTSLTLQLIHAIAEGKTFAGLNTKQTPVSYIDLENPISVLKDRIKYIGQSDNILIWHGSCEPSPARLDRADYIRYFELPKGLIVFDTLRASFLGDENNSRDIAVIVDRLKQFRDKSYTILLLHHTPKSNDSIYKGSTAILDLVDHALCLEPIKDDDEPIDFDPERIYKFGVKIKTRFEPFSVYLQFDPSIKGFCIAKDPDMKRIEAIYEILKELPAGLKQKDLKEKAKNELDLTEFQIRKLLKRGESISAWDIQKGGNGKENRALIYIPNFDWLIGRPIYSHPINLTKQETDKNLSNQATLNNQQTLDNTCLVDRTGSVYPINTSDRCSGCMLTSMQRTLCEVVRPCPKGVTA